MITRVRKLILEQPLPQWKLAGEIGIHPSTLSAYGLGRVPMLAKHLPLFTRYFNVPPEKVLGWVDEPDILEMAEEYKKIKENA